jgi:hypothetical protein
MSAPPFFKPSPGRINVSAWKRSLGTDWIPLESALTDWNPGTSLDISRELSIDLSGLRAECGLPDRTPVRITVSWSSDASKMGGRVLLLELHEEGAPRLLGTLDGMRIGGRVHLRTTVSACSGTWGVDGAPTSPGSVLFEDTHSISLGEDSGRFPVCVDDFTNTPYDHDASWFFEIDSSDLSVPFIAGSVLHLNSRDEKLVNATVADAPSAVQKVLVQELSHGLSNHLLDLAMLVDQAEPLGAPSDWPVGSLGATLALILNGANLSGANLSGSVESRARLRATVEGTNRRQGKGRAF